MEDQSCAPSHIPICRTDETKEVAFAHTLPSTCWDEVTHDYGAILDIAVGVGSLALTAVRKRITLRG
ncbi:MAG: hypothetical protein ACKPKO_04130, partial [Candidatus Fonsibacter sp.]